MKLEKKQTKSYEMVIINIQYSSNQHMERFSFLLVLTLFFLIGVSTSDPIVNYRLSTIGPTSLQVGSALISTLGHFRATLQRTGCILTLQSFNGSTYNFVKNVSGASNSDCSSLSVRGSDASLITDKSAIYLSLNKTICNLTEFNLDDTGVFRLICTENNTRWAPEKIGFETTLNSNGAITSTYFTVVSKKVVSNQLLDKIINEGGWSIQVANVGQLTISDSQDPNIFASYYYPPFEVNPGKIKDATGKMPPDAVFQDLHYFPRCGYMDYHTYRAPYIFQFDQYWPIFRVRDHTGYPLVTFKYPIINCFNDFGLLQDRNWKCSMWVCPSQLFKHKGTCVQSCPAPLFHMVKSNETECVVNCQLGATRDNISRLCTCGPAVQSNCPSGSVSYPLGCVCSMGYYDGISACLDSCRPGYFGKDGVCLSCPFRCKTCDVNNDTIKSTYLVCIQCLDGYSIKNGVCKKTCNQLLGFTPQPDGSCMQCKDSNCLNCTTPDMCIQCAPLYALQFDGTCGLDCGNDTRGRIESRGFVCIKSEPGCSQAQSFNFTTYSLCLSCSSNGFTYADTCVSSCQSASSDLVSDIQNRSCRCADSTKILVGRLCMALPNCPIKMYFNQSLGACRSCPYGCLTCVEATCTSCAPGFILAAYIVPACVYNSPWYQCLVDYHLQSGQRCVMNYPTDEYKQCYAAVPGCYICKHKANDLCVTCRNGTYMFKQTCVSSCPSGTFLYGGACQTIDPIDTNCMTTSVGTVSTFTNIGRTFGVQAPLSAYYSQNKLLPDNNPIIGIQDGSGVQQYQRITYFRQAIYNCKMCQPGFATGPDGRCVPCDQSCKYCFTPEADGCLNCSSGYVMGDRHVCYINSTNATCLLHQYMNANHQCIDYCTGYYLPQGIGGVNCTESCPSGTSPIKVVNNTHQYECARTSNNQGGNYLKFDAAAYPKPDNTFVAYLVPSQKFASLNPTLLPTFKFANSRLLQSTNSTTQATNEYILFNTSQDSNLFLVNFQNSLSSLKSVSGSYPAQLNYGIEIGNSRPQYAQKDLALVGYFASIFLLILHVIYVGNDIMYKVDNTLILAQTVFLFLFTSSIQTINLSQFYYGWKFSHIGFMYNFFQGLIPDKYHQDAPLSFKLVTEDANIIRNAGYSYSLFLLFLGIFGLVLALLYLAKSVFRKNQPWRPQSFKNAFFGFTQLLIINLIFFSVTQLRYSSSQAVTDPHFRTSCNVLAAFTLFIVAVYSLGRLYFTKIGGAYCLKRFLIAIIMASSHNDYLPGYLILVEAAFLITRYLIEKPIKTSETVMLVAEQILIILAYLTMMLSNVPAANIIVVGVVMGLFALFLLYDLIRVYTEAMNEWDYNQDVEEKNMRVIAGTERLQS